MFRTSVFLRTADCERGGGKKNAHCYFLLGRNGSYNYKEKYSTSFLLTSVRTITVFCNKTYGKIFTAYEEFHIQNGLKQDDALSALKSPSSFQNYNKQLR